MTRSLNDLYASMPIPMISFHCATDPGMSKEVVTCMARFPSPNVCTAVEMLPSVYNYVFTYLLTVSMCMKIEDTIIQIIGSLKVGSKMYFTKMMFYYNQTLIIGRFRIFCS